MVAGSDTVGHLLPLTFIFVKNILILDLEPDSSVFTGHDYVS